MDYRTWQKALENVLSSFGFDGLGDVYLLRGEDVVVFVSSQNEEVIKQRFINVGFWLLPLGKELPKKVEHTHIDFRLERIFPEQRELILSGGDFSDSNIKFHFNKLLQCMEKDICRKLSTLGDLQSLKIAFDRSLNEQGLVRGEAREFLRTFNDNQKSRHIQP